MEHRLHKRVSVDMTVKLVIDNHVVGVSRTSEISSGGVRIFNPGLVLQHGQMIGIDFIKTSHPKHFSSYVRAMVIHSTPNVIGLMFATEFAANAFIKPREKQLQYGEFSQYARGGHA